MCLCLKLHLDLHMPFAFIFEHFEKQSHKLAWIIIYSYVYPSCLLSINNKNFSKKWEKQSPVECV